jgi:hypothetical protein
MFFSVAVPSFTVYPETEVILRPLPITVVQLAQAPLG